ncbi:MAG: hypothetical protein ACRC9X_00155 [Bacteroidales bacterium]
MITDITLASERTRFENEMPPHRILQLGEIIHTGENIFKIGNIEVEASECFVSNIDNLLNISSKQAKLVKNTSGETGLRNFRNYMSVAINKEQAKKVVILADKNRKLIDVVPLVDDYISPKTFFDFVDLFLDRTQYSIHTIASGRLWEGVTVYMNAPKPLFASIAKDEEFITNGVYIDWSFSGIEIGSYFSRMVCINGMMVNERRKQNTIYSLNSKQFQDTLTRILTGHFHQYNFERFAKNALRAMKTQASIKELCIAKDVLLKLKVPAEIAEQLLPHSTESEQYKRAGIKLKQRGRFAKSSMTIWDIYNHLTAFATHTNLWSAHNLHRGEVMLEAEKFIGTSHDVINYDNIY